MSDQQTNLLIQNIQEKNIKKYDFYNEFMNLYYNKEIKKLMDVGDTEINFKSIKNDVKLFAQNLGIELTNSELTTILYEVKS